MRRFSRPRHATVVAYLALFTGLSGGAYAAATITGADIVDGSVTSADVQDHTLTGLDVLDGSVAGADLAWKSVNGSKVVDDSLSSLDIKDGSISAADLKPGALGMAKVQTVSATSANDSTQIKEVLAKCPSGWRTIGGGAWVYSHYWDIPQVGLQYSRAHQFSIDPPLYGWYAVAAEHSPTGEDWKLSAEAYCIQMEG